MLARMQSGEKFLYSVGATNMESRWRVLKKLKIELLCDPAVPL
jgi:hypothetical protein